MGNNVIPRQQGDAYQASFFWLQACKLYQPHTGVAKIEWESNSSKGFDDVILHYHPAKLDEGDNIITENYQVKFHVDHTRSFTCDALIDPSFIGTKTESILNRLHKFYKDNPEVSKCSRFYVVNTWGIDSQDELRNLIGNGGALLLDRLFDRSTDRSKYGKIRQSWREHLGISSDEDLKKILRPLRIRHNYEDLHNIIDPLNTNLINAGFKPIAADKRITGYQELIQRLHAEGKKVFTKEELFDICKNEDLVAIKPQPEEDFHIIGVRSFQRGAETLELEVNELLCLLNRFSGRFLFDDTTWLQIYPVILAFADKALAIKKPLLIHLDTHLSIAFSLGYCLDFKCGAEVSLIQKTIKGKLLWKPEPEKLSAVGNEFWDFYEYPLGRSGNDIAIGLSVTHNVKDEVILFAKEHLPDTAKVITASIKPGPSNTALQNANHIIVAVQELVSRIRAEKASISRMGKIHLFMAAPNAFAFFLGQQSKPLGKITLYEYDFENLLTGGYQASIFLPIM